MRDRPSSGACSSLATLVNRHRGVLGEHRPYLASARSISRCHCLTPVQPSFIARQHAFPVAQARVEHQVTGAEDRVPTNSRDHQRGSGLSYSSMPSNV